jgi:hypothetical protein
MYFRNQKLILGARQSSLEECKAVKQGELSGQTKPENEEKGVEAGAGLALFIVSLGGGSWR